MSKPASDLTAARQRPVILIVDDEEMVTESLGSFLQMETDYQVVMFQSPLEALKMLHQRQVDLVISDFLMPEMDGLHFLSEVKKMYPEVPRVLLTAYADKQNTIKAINEVGLFQYVEKPWDNEQVKLMVSNGITNKSLKEILDEKIRELDRALLQKEELAQRDNLLREELALARQVQEGMLLQSFPHTDKISFAVKYQPALDIGGDYYDVVPMAKDQLGVLIADVTGHGISAALSTVLLKVAFSGFMGRDAGPAEILVDMNSLLCKGLPKGILVAAMVLTIDTQSALCRIVNGGIPHPVLLRRKQQQAQRIAANGYLLGLFQEELYRPHDEEMRIQLEEDDCLILYTDGLSEAENQAGKFFGSGSLIQTLLRSCDRPGSEIVEDLATSARQFSQPDHEWDDMTILGMEVKS